MDSAVENSILMIFNFKIQEEYFVQKPILTCCKFPSNDDNKTEERSLPAEDASDAVPSAGVDEARLGQVPRPDEVERPVQEGPQPHRLLLQLSQGLK